MHEPWKDEPDSLEFESHGLKCLILRHREMLHLCGYVGVSRGHFLFGEENEFCYNHADISVHWGLTYHNGRPGRDGADDGLWYLGFDCAHLHDLSPGMEHSVFFDPSATYRNIRYVKEECENLAAQLAAMKAPSRWHRFCRVFGRKWEELGRLRYQSWRRRMLWRRIVRKLKTIYTR